MNEIKQKINVIVYCDDCMSKLKSLGIAYEALFESIVENYIIDKELTEFDLTTITDFNRESLKFLEKNGYIATAFSDENSMHVLPSGYNLRASSLDIDIYQCEVYDICFESEHLISYEIG
jgi:hypothetical protein